MHFPIDSPRNGRWRYFSAISSHTSSRGWFTHSEIAMSMQTQKWVYKKIKVGISVSSRGAIDASERIKSLNISIQVFSYCHCVLSTSETPDFVRGRVMLTAWSTSQSRLRLVELDINRSDITIRQNGKGIRKDGDTACMPTSPSPGFEEACSQNICWCICLRTLFVCDPRYLREYRMLSCMHSI